MALIVWSDDMKVGVPPVDHEHEMLIRIINELGSLLEGGGGNGGAVEALLGEIHAQIEAHFALEEKIMREKGYSGYEAHKEDHDRLLEQIRDIMEDAGHISDKALNTELSQRLTVWFSEHFRTLDRSFHQFAGE